MNGLNLRAEPSSCWSAWSRESAVHGLRRINLLILSFENLGSDGSGEDTFTDWASHSALDERLRLIAEVGDARLLVEIGDIAVLTNKRRDKLGVAAGLLTPT